MSEDRYLWFTINTIPNYEQKVAADIRAIRVNMNLREIREVIVPTEKYFTATGKEKEKPKFPNYFYVKLQVDGNDQPPTWLWHKIRNLKGCIGILVRDKYMLGLTDDELKSSLELTDEEISEMSGI